MQYYYLTRLLLFCVLSGIYFQSFSQFGEKQIIDDSAVDEILKLIVDINDDGYSDLIVLRRDKDYGYSEIGTGYAGSYFLKINNGGNNFEEEILIKYDENEWRVILPVDIDNDNDLDLAIRNELNELTWLINNNNSFSWKFRIDNDYYGPFQFGDINNDGFTDYIKQEDTGSRTKYFSFLNDGSGKFETRIDLHEFEGFTDINRLVKVLDIDADGFNDIIFNHKDSLLTLELLPNDQIIRNEIYVEFNRYENRYNLSGFEFSDLDNNGLTDIVSIEWAGDGGESDFHYRVFFNEGQYNFNAISKGIDPVDNYDNFRSTGIILKDLNNDGYLDIVTQRSQTFLDSWDYKNPASLVFIHYNNKDASFTTERLPIENARQLYRSAKSEKFLVSYNGLIEEIRLNPNGEIIRSPFYKQESSFFLNYWDKNKDARKYTTQDIDKDGKKDIIVGEYSSLGIYLSSMEYDKKILDTHLEATRSIDVGDINNDSEFELILSAGDVGYRYKSAFYKNLLGDTEIENYSSSIWLSNLVRFVDLNNDGFIDIFAGNNQLDYESIHVILNNEGKLNDSKNYLLSSQGETVLEITDFDEDGFPDAISNNVQDELLVYINDQTGNFSDPDVIASNLDVSLLRTAGILNNDIDFGVLDEKTKSIILYKRTLNALTLEEVKKLSFEYTLNDFALADIDLDNDLDIIVALDDPDLSLSWLENLDGSSEFSDVKNLGYSARKIHVDDLDSDGDVDLTIASGKIDDQGNSLGLQELYILENLSTGNIENKAPTDITLSNATVEENQPASTLAGKFSTTDEDEADEHTYSLVDGEGSEGNEFFTIKNNELFTLKEFDFEEQASYSIRVQTDDGKGGKFSKSFEVQISDIDESTNAVPTDIALSKQSIKENEPSATLVGVLSATDPDEDDEHTYALVSGAGDTGNDFFVIKDDQLLTLKSFDYEALPETSVRIEANDGNGGKFQKSFTISIEDVADDKNEAPTDITLSNTSIDENTPTGTLVGTLSAEDADDTEFTFSLVAGGGNANNGQFIIEGDQLLTAASFDYEVQDHFSIRVQADDGKGGTYSKQFWIDVNDVEDDANNAPTYIRLSNQTIEENKAVGTVVGVFSTDDEDADDEHVYSLVEGEETTDNASFTIEGNQLKSNAVFDYETRQSYVIKVQADDGKGGTLTTAFIINVIDVEEDESPLDIVLSNASVEENKPKGTLVGEFSTKDNKADHSYQLVSGEGDDDNGLFAISGNQLLTDEVFDYEAKDSYTIRVRVTSSEGDSFEKAFTISVTDINDNTAPVLSNLLPDQKAVVDEAFSFVIPKNTFTDEDAGDELSYAVTLGDGSDLPAWLSFDAETLTLSGSPTEDGTVSIRVVATDQQGATASDEFMLTIEGVTAVNDEIFTLYRIYPNPAANFIIIEHQNKAKQVKHCRIIDNTGRIVRELRVKNTSDVRLDVADLTPGNYQLELVLENEALQYRILKH